MTTVRGIGATGQAESSSDGEGADEVGLLTAITLANLLVVRAPSDPEAELRRVLAVDPPSVARLAVSDVGPLTVLAADVHAICSGLIAADIDGAAERVNALLCMHSAHPHLALEDGRWRLHHHPPGAEVVPMWTAITADAFARLIDAGRDDRIGRCAAPGCELLFLDTSKNGSRRFCSTTCQNRVKAAAYRRRRRGSP